VGYKGEKWVIYEDHDLPSILLKEFCDSCHQPLGTPKIIFFKYVFGIIENP
jgi:hypothetical protein